MFHHVLFDPLVLLSIVRLPDMSLVSVAEYLTILPILGPSLKVTLVLPLSPSSSALGLACLDPELGGKVSTMPNTAIFGNRPYVVSIKGTATADIFAVIRADDISSGGNSDKKNKTKQHVADVSLVSCKYWINLNNDRERDRWNQYDVINCYSPNVQSENSDTKILFAVLLYEGIWIATDGPCVLLRTEQIRRIDTRQGSYISAVLTILGLNSWAIAVDHVILIVIMIFGSLHDTSDGSLSRAVIQPVIKILWYRLDYVCGCRVCMK
eukprot:sb/3468262/